MTLIARPCPECHHRPTVKMEHDYFSIECERPGHWHMAVGQTMDQAVFNWNIYIDLLSKEREETPHDQSK